MKMKTKINLEKQIEETELPEEIIKFLEEDGILEFFDPDKIKDVEEIIPDSYLISELELLGKKYGIIMKQQLAEAILDPNENDANILKEAGERTRQKLSEAYEKKKLKPLESNFEKTLFKAYLNSLIMNLVKYPKDELNEETLTALGLKNPEISKLYVQAAAAWLGSDEESEKVIQSKGIISKIDKIGYSGKEERIDLSIEQCHKGSHYVLKTKINKQQLDVQIEVPKISQKYFEIENEIIKNINTENETIRNNAVNLIRLYLNMTLFYDKGKPLPLEWNK